MEAIITNVKNIRAWGQDWKDVVKGNETFSMHFRKYISKLF